MEIRGVDVSRWQGDIDWKRVKAAGVGFAMIKAAQGTRPDPRFDKNFKDALKSGVYAGAYVYSLAVTPGEAKAEAEAVLEQTRGRELRYPIALDLEDERLEKLKKRELGEVIKAFCGAVRAGGRIPMIYSNLDWFKNRIPKSAVKGEYVWLACWRDSLPDEDFGCAMWQKGSGSVDGIEGEADIDVSFIDFAALTAPEASYALAVPRRRGDEYAAMQRALNAGNYRDAGGKALTVDGIWGKRSFEAFQKLVSKAGEG
jgi:GH25 family lysozyme M1 (1,4-beta-N-acetylmuramidase)